MAAPSLADLLALDTSGGTTAPLQRRHATPPFRGLKSSGRGHKQSCLLASNGGQESTASCSPCVPDRLSKARHLGLKTCSFTRSFNLRERPSADFTARDSGAPHVQLMSHIMRRWAATSAACHHPTSSAPYACRLLLSDSWSLPVGRPSRAFEALRPAWRRSIDSEDCQLLGACEKARRSRAVVTHEHCAAGFMAGIGVAGRRRRPERRSSSSPRARMQRPLLS